MAMSLMMVRLWALGIAGIVVLVRCLTCSSKAAGRMLGVGGAAPRRRWLNESPDRPSPIAGLGGLAASKHGGRSQALRRDLWPCR